jgi:hypothetical protein
MNHVEPSQPGAGLATARARSLAAGGAGRGVTRTRA